MNIIKLQNELKGVPDDALISYVQNPTGQVPSYLALSELQRRKEMREKYKAAQPEKTTVAEDLAAPPQPQGIAAMQQPAQAPVAEPGVAGLPVPDQMFSGQGMAAGGIVAFDDGGDVVAGERGMNLTDLPSLNVNTGEQGYGGKSYYMTPDGSGMYAGRFFKDAYRQSPNPLFKLFSQLPNDKVFTRQMADGGEVKGFAGPEGSYVLPSDYDPETYLANYQQELLGIPSYVAGEQFPGEGARKAKKELQKMAKTPYDAAIAYYEGLPKPMISSTPAYLNPENVLRREREKWFEQKGSIAQDKKIADTQDKKQQTQQNIDKAIADSKVKPTPGGGGITSVLPKPMTLDEAIQREKDAYRKMGVDENFYTDQAKKLQEEREALKGEKSQAGWMALAKAGLGMAAGKSPFALQNIATGAMQGLEQYGVDVKDLKKEQNLLRASDQKLAEAQYLQSRGDAQGALKAMDEREKLLVQAQQHKETIAAHIQSAQISAGAKSGMAQLPALYKVLASTTDPAQQKQIQDRIDAILAGEGNVPSGPTKTPTKPLSSFGG